MSDHSCGTEDLDQCSFEAPILVASFIDRSFGASSHSTILPTPIYTITPDQISKINGLVKLTEARDTVYSGISSLYLYFTSQFTQEEHTHDETDDHDSISFLSRQTDTTTST